MDINEAYKVRNAVSKWLRIKFKHENRGPSVILLRKLIEGKNDWDIIPWRDIAGQLTADTDHSSLLVWILTGHEPLPEPPPLKNAYPVYPWEEE